MRKPYKMKGSEFFGHGNASPAKVSDDVIMNKQAELNELEIGYKPDKGWGMASTIHDSVIAPHARKGKGKGNGKKKSTSENVSDAGDAASSIGEIGKMFGNLS
tara:strand:- start:592 stop:900 length:309 start_codon:yes stop_codon:yes gene_type:complete